MADEKNVHAGHRKRMKSAMLEHGIDGLNDHQVLEMLLFYAVPKIDTNPIAHRLIEEFGSLRNVLEADYEELVEIKGIGENAASLIKFSQQFSGRYLRASSFEEDSQRFTDTDALRRYYEGVFLGVKNEQIRAMLVDDNLFMIKEQMIMEGTVGKAEFSIRKFADFVIKNSSNRVVIAHNHPNGSPMPSKEDIIVTKELYTLLEKLEISLVDHIIVGRAGSFSLRSKNYGYSIWPVNRRN